MVQHKGEEKKTDFTNFYMMVISFHDDISIVALVLNEGTEHVLAAFEVSGKCDSKTRELFHITTLFETRLKARESNI